MQCAMVLMFLRSFSLLGCLYVLFASVHVLCIIVLFFLDVCLLACFWRVLVAWLRWNVYQVHGITYTPSIYIYCFSFSCTFVLSVTFLSHLSITGAAGRRATAAVRRADTGLRGGVSPRSGPAYTGRGTGRRRHQGGTRGEFFFIPPLFSALVRSQVCWLVG